jgi:AraC-like DNA-binding protein
MHATAWPPVLATRGPGFLSALHAHHALHFVLAIGGTLRVRESASGPWKAAAGALTPPDGPHAVDARGAEVLVVFLDPESDAGSTFRTALGGGVRLISARERSDLVRDVVPRTMMTMGVERWVGDAARTLGVPLPPMRRLVHPRVRRILRSLRESGVDDATSLEALAVRAGLSPGRLMHAFTASVGIPLRPYLAWLRVQRAATAIVGGSPLGDAAHAAGFSDASHMCRTFRRMLGVAPSALRPMRCLPEPERAAVSSSIAMTPTYSPAPPSP